MVIRLRPCMNIEYRAHTPLPPGRAHQHRKQTNSPDQRLQASERSLSSSAGGVRFKGQRTRKPLGAPLAAFPAQSHQTDRPNIDGKRKTETRTRGIQRVNAFIKGNKYPILFPSGFAANSMGTVVTGFKRYTKNRGTGLANPLIIAKRTSQQFQA